MPEQALDVPGSVREKRSEVFARFSPSRLRGCAPVDVRRVLVIDAASRSGSSFLHHRLARHADILALNGENVVFEKLHDIGLIESERDSDVSLDNAAPDLLKLIAEDILKDCGALHDAAVGDRFPDEDYLADSIQRLILQYPEIDFPVDALREACAAAPRASYWLAVLKELSGRGYPVSPAHYDLRGSDPAADFPDAKNAAAPPFTDFCLEEPPFVVPQPRSFPSKDALGAKTLLLKSSSNCYHIRALKKMFPNARFRFVVLSRNPAAGVSGLMDGWLSNGFYSRDAGRLSPLAIKGYSQDRLPWTRRWWNFDLPPGWADYRERSLEEVCAFQWASANEHVLRDVADKTIRDHIMVRYESFLDAPSLVKELERILDFAGLRGPLPAADSARVMSVTPPAPQKWRKRRDALAPLMKDEKIRSLAAALGYEPRDWESWV